MNRPSWTRDPAAPSLALFAGLVVGGFVAIALGWKVAARTLFVPSQVPAIVSGAMGGVTLVLMGVVLTNIQVGRRTAALERAETELLLDEATALVAAFQRKHS